ncbi:MAG: hypothetical protein FJ042_00480 [Candidatus Cloacimonetes bacterium]|nr:hypothetical protein [Candidatus Cloacimonadota bacterium]
MYLNLFDDHDARFYPLTFSRSTGDLRCGILKLRQRLSVFLNAEDDAALIEPRLFDLYKERHPDWMIPLHKPGVTDPTQLPNTLYVNTRVKVIDRTIEAIKALMSGQALVNGDDLIALHSNQSIPKSFNAAGVKQDGSYHVIDTEYPIYHHLADLIHDNKRLIEWDFQKVFNDKDSFFDTELGVTILNPYNVWLGEGAVLKPGVVIDASDGPVVIDVGACIMPNAVIVGPAYIGKKSIIKIGAKIYPGTSIGPVCKVGGEVEDSIFQGYSNKQHDGFLGHSFIGEWVNLGADTNNSDLKNNYHPVKFYSYADGDKIDSQSQFLGAMIGDHTKIGINCSINTGCVIGVGCNLYGSALISDHIPSFSWGTADDPKPFRFDAFIQTAQIVKQRRGMALSRSELELYNHLYIKESNGKT